MRIGARSKPKRRRGLMAALIVAATLVALEVWLNSIMRPVIENIVEYQAQIFATRLINETMLSQMEKDDVSYDKLVRIVHTESGEISSIEADMAQINRFKSRVSAAVIENLEQMENQSISVPLGTIIGNQFTSGRGPLVEIKVVPKGYVQCEIYNEFSSAGINQTLHQIMLQVTVQMTAVLPGYSIETETLTNFCIAETVIIGNIPQGYASFGQGAATYAAVGPDAAER